MKNRILSITRGSIPYVKELRPLADSWGGCIVMQQLDYWFARYPDGFYKFTEPCPKHSLYKEGDSWTEELGCTADEFRTAFDSIGARHKSKSLYGESKNPFEGKFYCSYHDKRRGVTWYFRSHATVDAALGAIVQQPQDQQAETPAVPSSPCNSTVSSYRNRECPVTLYTENTAKYSQGDESAMSPGSAVQPNGEAAKSKLLQGAHAATVVAYPDKVLSAPDLSDKPNEYIQPFMGSRVFEFEQPCREEGSTPLWEEFDQQEETIAQPITLNVQTIEPIAKTIAPPEPEQLDTTNQSPLVPKDRIKKEKKVPPRSRQKSQHALNRAYTFDAAGWLQLPEANGCNSVPRAIAVRVMQEILLTDHGESIDVFWEQDDEGNWLVLDSKHSGEAEPLDAMFGSKGRLPLGKLRDCCAGFSGVSQEEFNRDLQMLYEIALEFCEAGGVLGRLDYGERWIDQDLFAEYLEDWL
jgi:hypothetical protein